MSTSDLSAPVRRAIFEAMVATAWADTVLERAEILAVKAAGKVLELPDDVLEALDAGPPSVRTLGAGLDDAERKLVYLCAAWVGAVDGHENEDEDVLLRELREALALDASTATMLRDEARTLHAQTTGSTPWYEELTNLIARARSIV